MVVIVPHTTLYLTTISGMISKPNNGFDEEDFTKQVEKDSDEYYDSEV